MRFRAWASPDAKGAAATYDPSGAVLSPRRLLGNYRPVLGPLDSLVREVDGPPDTLEPAEAGLPPGAARAEFVAARLRRDDVPTTWGQVEAMPAAEVDEISYRHGRSSVHMARADPSVLPYVQLGSWFNAGWKLRLVRRILIRAPAAPMLRRLVLRSGVGLRLRSDLAFWSGVRDEATPREWRRFTASSYVVLNYHRLAGERRPGQEQLDIDPRRFAMHMRLLAWLGYHPLLPEELVHFGRERDAVLPRRAYLATFDDAFEDNGGPLRSLAGTTPVLFAPTGAMGATATWAGGEPVLSWEDLRTLEATGVLIGSHTRSHPRLTELTTAAMTVELEGSRHDLAAHLARPVAAIAYPHGDHDTTVVRQAHAAGFSLGFGTLTGRNGAGTHPLCLRRVGIWAQDGPIRFMWKLITGELAPGQTRTGGLGWLSHVRRASAMGGAGS